jgi:hypothetical protein
MGLQIHQDGVKHLRVAESDSLCEKETNIHLIAQLKERLETP